MLSACGWKRPGKSWAKGEEVPRLSLIFMEDTWAGLVDQLTQPILSFCNFLFFQVRVLYILLRKHQVTLTLTVSHSVLSQLSL